jgi:bifunctional DNA-binding transcriptional regulator/antitoxin component of YhaV-PrlF toxin-antitoxin module
MTMTLTSKGQFTFNKGLLEHLGIRVGDQVSIRKVPDGKIEIEAQKNRIDDGELFARLDALAPVLNPKKKKCSIAEIDAAIVEGYVKAGMAGLE